MTRARHGWVIPVSVFFLMAARMPQDSRKHHASWWLSTYGEVDRSKDPNSARATRIFEKVAAAADKNGSRLPRLLVVAAEGDPYAVALPDGSVVLTRSGLTVCYRSVSRATGDARLAFVLGHELSHLAKDDFWHASAFAAVQAHGGGRAEARNLGEILRPNVNDQKTKELQADAYGLLYMTMAGYEPRALLDGGGAFFQSWVAQVSGEAAYDDPTHPSPAERAAFLRAQLEAVAGEIGFFHFGTRLYQIGRYEEAILLLERFRSRYPGREVLNNLGLSHYQLAARFLGECDGSLLLRFKLPAVLDPETRARTLRAGSPQNSPCLQSVTFRERMKEATRLFELAIEMDSQYLPARLNLASAATLAGRPAQALTASQEALSIAPQNPAALMMKAIALYLFGRESNIDTAGSALQILEELRKNHGQSPEILFNLGAVLAEQRKTAEVRAVWDGFLALEPRGIYARSVAEWLDRPYPEDAVYSNLPRGLSSAPSIRLGSPTSATLKRLGSMERIEFLIGTLKGAIYRGPSVQVLEINSAVEVVEEDRALPTLLVELEKGNAAPARVVQTTTGRVLVFNGVAFEASHQEIRRIIHFQTAKAETGEDHRRFLHAGLIS